MSFSTWVWSFPQKEHFAAVFLGMVATSGLTPWAYLWRPVRLCGFHSLRLHVATEGIDASSEDHRISLINETISTFRFPIFRPSFVFMVIDPFLSPELPMGIESSAEMIEYSATAIYFPSGLVTRL
jgi:hypothetical protein